MSEALSPPSGAGSPRSRWRRGVGRRLRRVAVPAALVGVLAAGTLAPAQAGPTADSEVVTSTGRSGNSVAFTFDDGPNPNDTPRLLSFLKQQQVTAVFCLWGDHVKQYPDLVRQIAADGHLLCNHSMHHDDMGFWSPDQIRADLEETSAAIRAAVPNADIRYFRAPNGSWGQTPQVAAELGLQPLGWRLAIEDWAPPGADELARRLRDGITPGAVVLLHDGGGDRSQTVDAVEQVIPEFKAQGWSFDLPAKSGG